MHRLSVKRVKCWFVYLSIFPGFTRRGEEEPCSTVPVEMQFYNWPWKKVLTPLDSTIFQSSNDRSGHELQLCLSDDFSRNQCKIFSASWRCSNHQGLPFFLVKRADPPSHNRYPNSEKKKITMAGIKLIVSHVYRVLDQIFTIAHCTQYDCTNKMKLNITHITSNSQFSTGILR